MTTLTQTGRAGMQFCGSLQRYSSSVLADRAKEDFYQDEDMAALGDVPLGPRPDEELDQIARQAAGVANRSPSHRFNRFFQRFVAEAVYDRGIPAAEERRDRVSEILPVVKEVHPNAGELHLNPDIEEPDDYEGVEWHLMPGGWDGYDLSMLMFFKGVGPYIFKHGGFAAVDLDANTQGHRMTVLNELPRDDYKRIYEAGCGGTSTLAVIRKKFPNAELVGSDLSKAMQMGGHKMDQAFGLNVTLKQEDCRKTTEPDNHYDAVVSYAVFHELSDESAKQTIEEMFRILAPGGDFIISDPGPLKALTPYQAVIYDWETENREEPHFSASIRRSLPDLMRSAGFVHVKDYGVGPGNYPWVTLGTKPA